MWGPAAGALLATLTDTPLSQAAFPYGTLQEAIIDGVPATMLRISYVGENGWEIYARTPHGAHLWTRCWRPGAPSMRGRSAWGSTAPRAG